MARPILFALSLFIVSLALAAPASAGQEMVPDVVGLSVEKAQALLKQAGFSARVEHVQGRPLGIVFSQDPGGLATRSTNAPVTIRVGGAAPKPGPTRDPVNLPPTHKPPLDDLPPVELPPIRDPDAGPTTKPSDDLGAPPAGSTQPRDMGTTGTTPSRPATMPTRRPTRQPATPTVTDLPTTAGVLMWNGRPIPAEAMPNTNGPDLPSVLGQQASQARGALNRWRVTVEQTRAMPELVGKVLNQWPYAGTQLAPGEEVTVVVGVANAPSDRHRGVPQIVQREWRQAVRAVESAGFTPVVTAVPCSDSRRGKVISQAPLPGSMAVLGSAMRIRVGRGTGTYSPTAPRDLPVQPPTEPRPAPTQPRDPIDDGPPAGVPTIPDVPVVKPPVDTPAQPPVVPPTQPTQPRSVGSLSAPSLSGPPAGESYPHKYGADFSWSSVNGASAYELELQEELPSGAWQSVKIHEVATTRFRPARLERGRYRWRVRAVAGAGKGTWSDFRRLYMY